MAKIQTVVGGFDQTCTYETDLAANALKEAAYREVLEYTERRNYTTLIVSGAKTPWDIQDKETNVPKTKIGNVPDKQTVGDSGYRYRLMGKIQKPTIINQQIGTSGPSGEFTLSVQDKLYPGLNVRFWHPNVEARVSQEVGGTPGNYIYNFQTISGVVFNYSTMVNPQPGQKTLFGQYTSYGEKSIKGYSIGFYPDEYINHMTTQRKEISVTGAALNTVVRVSLGTAKGWYYTKVSEGIKQANVENDFQKLFGQSSWKDANGNLMAVPRVLDMEAGSFTSLGDGLWEQIRGGNEAYTSGPNGTLTIDDVESMMTRLKKNTDQIQGQVWYVISATDGTAAMQKLLAQVNTTTYGGRMVVEVMNNGTKVGGPDVPTGGNFNTYNFAGSQIINVEHPMFGDEERWNYRVGNDGKLIMGSTYLWLDNMTLGSGSNNLEILTRAAYGSNRSFVTYKISGPTGGSEQVITPVDAMVYGFLKEDQIVAYRTETCGILHKTP